MTHPCTVPAPPPPSVQVLIAQALGIASQEVRPYDRLVEDLRIDSLEMASLLVDIENACGVVIDAAALKDIHTVAQLEAAVQQRAIRDA